MQVVSLISCLTPGPWHQDSDLYLYFCAVAFSIYDLDNTSYIEPGEVNRLMGALLKENPSINLGDEEIDGIIDQVGLAQNLSSSKVVLEV